METIFIPRNRTVLNKVQKAIKKSQKSLLCVTAGNIAKNHMIEVIGTDLFKKKALKDLKIHIITEEPKKLNNDPISERLPPNIRFRFVRDPLQAHLLIIDKKEVFVKLSTTGSFAENPSIWSSNPCLVAIAHNYFEHCGIIQ